MQTELAPYYYNVALEYAQNGHLSKALELCAAAWGFSETNETPEIIEATGATGTNQINKINREARKLAGLCYYSLGNYVMADYCFKGLEYYSEDIQKSVRQRLELINSVNALIEGGQYKKAFKILKGCPNKSAAEWNLLGRLYAVKKQKDKAVSCFAQALEINKDGAVEYIKYAGKIKKRLFR